MTLTGVHPTGRFGEIISDEKGQVVEFNEKPSVSGGRVSGGFFVCRKEIFRYLDSRDDLVFELEPMSQLAKDRQLGLYEHNGFWQPMDTYRDYAALNALVAGRRPHGCYGNDLPPNLAIISWCACVRYWRHGI
jgi:glucose-1-phosphate cytidylyltransferase